MKRVQELRRPAPPHWVGDGFPVRTFLSYAEPEPFSPFLLLDYAAPSQFAPAKERRGVGPHPHRGFETVTVVYHGEVEHRDSAGHGGKIGPGDVQWMTAASGVVHEEMHSAEFTKKGGPMEMVQLWVNLPARDKMSKPRYQDLTKAAIPVLELPGGAGTARVIAGAIGGTRGPAKTFTPIDLWDLSLRRGRPATFALPAGHTALLLVQHGTVRVGANDDVAAMQLAILDRSDPALQLEARDDDARLLVMSGAPIPEPVVGHGPFVMNTRAEIHQAIVDFEQGRMGSL
ncbi:MAG: pirin family protein [Planctomycetota bacterium]